MTVGLVSLDADNAAVGGAAAAGRPLIDGDSEFSKTLSSRAAVDSGSANLDAIFDVAGQRYNISPNLLKAVAKVESNFRPNVTSKAGAMGIMQLMPGTARGLGVTDAFDPEQNIMGGAKYLRQMLDRFDGDLSLALGAYNAGPGAVAKHGGVPSYSQNYVSKVIGIFSGGDITAGSVAYGGLGQSEPASAAPSGSFDFAGAMSQMIFIKLIEMQMNSSNDDKKKVF